ncbi:MAG: hypothetical protein P4L90_13810 [Rhodopila sp.]|nr:hypothetical protein [Rhodopila sp.]
MKMTVMIRAAFAVLSLTTAIVPVANAAIWGGSDVTHRQGPYDNTGNGPQETGLAGGGG